MTLNQNQFAQKPVQGMLDQMQEPNTIPVQIDTSAATALLPGQSLTMVDSAGGVPKMIAATAASDVIWGFINFNLKNASFAALSACEMSSKGNVMWMTASAAIARGAKLNVVIASTKVVTDAADGSTVIGRAFDKATADGDLIRVIIATPV